MVKNSFSIVNQVYFWCSELLLVYTQNKRNTLKNILYNITCMTENSKIKLYYDQYSLEESSTVLTLYMFNRTPEVVAWGSIM